MSVDLGYTEVLWSRGVLYIFTNLYKMNIERNRCSCLVSSSCCYPQIRSQLNGANGEATNSDDVKKGARDRKQDTKINELTRVVTKLLARGPSSLVPKKKKKKNRQTSSYAHAEVYKGNPFPGIAQSSSLAIARPINHPDPVVVSAVAQLSPFQVPRGVASLLTEAVPSQKFTARALTSFTVPANDLGYLSIAPSVCSDATANSAFGFAGTSSELAAQTLALETLATGVTYLGNVSSNTPYSAATLAGNDYKWRCVSVGVRVRNTSAAVSRFGVLKYLLDNTHTLSSYNDSETINGLISKMDSSHKTVRRNMAMDPDVEIAVPGEIYPLNRQWFEASTSSLEESSFYPMHAGVIRKTSGGNHYAYGCLGIVFPAVSTAQSYDIEIVEHWEVQGAPIETLHTPSSGHASVSETLRTIVSQAHHQHSLMPQLSFRNILKGVSSAVHHRSALKQAAPLMAALSLI